MIDRTTGNVLPTNFIRPNYPGRAGVPQRVFLDELYRDYNAIQFEVRRRLANGFAWAANYTGSVTKQYTAYDWYRTAEDNESTELPQERQPAAQREVHLQLDDPGRESLPRQQRHREGRPRRLAVVGDHDHAGRHLVELHVQLHRAHRVSTVLTGGLGGSRVIIVCDPNLPRGERTFERQYRTECVRPPGPRTDPSDTLYQGTGVGAGQEDARMGLGYINHDLTLFKNFSLGNGRNLQFRAEFYNAFNTTQYQGVNTDRDVRLRDRSSRPTRRSARSVACAPTRTA